MKVKNLIVLLIIYIVTILLVLYFVALYKKSSTLVINESSINKIIKEVGEKKYDDIYNNINNYIVENHNFILYINSSDSKYSLYEKELMQFIIDNNIQDSFIYINLDNVKNNDLIKRIVNDFSNNNYVYEEKKVPLFIYFKDGVINSLIENDNLDLEFLERKLIELGGL